MTCEEFLERMPEIAAGFTGFSDDERMHVETCIHCSDRLNAMRATMEVLDEWTVPAELLNRTSQSALLVSLTAPVVPKAGDVPFSALPGCRRKNHDFATRDEELRRRGLDVTVTIKPENSH